MSSKKSLKHGINLIFLSVWFIMFVMQIIYIFALYQRSIRDTQATFYNSMTAAHSIIDQKVHICKQLSDTILNDSTTIDYFASTDSFERENLWRGVTAHMRSIYNITSEQYYVIAFDTDNKLLNFSADTSSPTLRLAKEAYAGFMTSREPLAFYTIPDTPFSDMLIFWVSDVNIPNIDKVEKTFLGTLAVAAKISKQDLIRQTGLEENVNLTLHYRNLEEKNVEFLSGNSDKGKVFWKENIDTSFWNMQGYADVDTPISTGLILLIAETLFMSVLFWVIQQFIKRNIFSPLYKVSDFLESYSLTKKNKRINLQNQTEIGSVADKIDEMIENIEQLSRHIVQTQQKLYESEIAQKDASLYALQAQLNPHFMYNTLDCICGIANASQVPQIADVTVALAKMLRYSLSEGRSVPLIQEIEIVKNYLTIMEVRRPNFFTAEFNISQDAEKVLCPKMLLQPIIENTFKHGFAIPVKDAHISICAKLESDCLLISIFDNGRGISEEKQADIINMLETIDHTSAIPSNGKVHIGLINIQNRIRLNYGDEYGLCVESKAGEFTKIILKLPKEI